MTVIVGYVDKNEKKVYLGGDSAATIEEVNMPRENPKVCRNGPYIMGNEGSYRYGDILQYCFKAPIDGSGHYDQDFMVTVFVPELQSILAESGYDIAIEGGDILVGVKGRLYLVQHDFNVGEYTSHYYAIGSGSHHAMGALHATESLCEGLNKTKKLTPQGKVKTALLAASGFSGGVSPPFHIIST